LYFENRQLTFRKEKENLNLPALPEYHVFTRPSSDASRDSNLATGKWLLGT
jgi:hypothetical protein